MYKLSKKLTIKSKAAFFLALELYNKPTIKYRTESFSILFTNAWELLLKAYIFEQSHAKKLSIFRRKKRNQKRESITIDDCLNKMFQNNNDPVRKNIEYVSEIRNEAAHLVVSELDPYFSRVFQAGITNYVRYLQNWFNVDINDELNPGLISLISDKDRISDLTLLKGKYNKEDFNAILSWVEKFNQLSILGEYAALSIKHIIAIVKNPKKADFVISAGKKGTRKALIIEKQRDPDVTHPFNRRAAIVEITKRITKSLRFNEYDFEAYVFVRGLKKTNNEYFYKGKYSGAGQYSQKFIDELSQTIKGNNKFLRQNRSQYKQYLKRKK